MESLEMGEWNGERGKGKLDRREWKGESGKGDSGKEELKGSREERVEQGERNGERENGGERGLFGCVSWSSLDGKGKWDCEQRMKAMCQSCQLPSRNTEQSTNRASSSANSVASCKSRLLCRFSLKSLTQRSPEKDRQITDRMADRTTGPETERHRMSYLQAESSPYDRLTESPKDRPNRLTIG